MSSGPPSADNKTIAKTAAAAFGGTWSVAAYTDAEERATVDVLSATETPEQGLTSFCTIGLSDHPIPGEVQPPLGVELVGTSNHAEFANVLATAAFHVINDGWVPEPDNVFTNIVSEHFTDVTTPHLFLVTPYLWQGLNSQKLTGKTVAYIQAVPITEEERALFNKQGADVLSNRLEASDPDIVDLWRNSTA